jgi:tetratricopeptide (TPR) repeat protein
MKDAYKKYTEAIHLDPKNPELKAKLHCNRASINLKYKNYGKVIEDCKISIKCDPTYIKAYYRMAKAYICLKKYDECIQLLNNQTEPELKALK